ncbi:MAG: transcriptional regulator [Candidatus Nanohaloarchaea archaeon]
MRFESEIVAEKILPAIRKLMAERLHSDYGHTQEEIAIELDLTQPAVSQYLKGKRADSELVEEMLEDPQIKILLEEAVSKAAKNQGFVQEISEIVSTGRAKGIFSEYFEDARKVT